MTPGAVAAGLADDGGRLAGDGRFVDRGDALDDLAVAGDDLPGLDTTTRSPGLRSVEETSSMPSPFGRRRRIGGRVAPRPPQRVGLGLAARLGEGRGEVGEQHGQEEPEVQRDEVARPATWLAERRSAACDDEQERQDGADLDHEHHRVLPLDVRPQHDERLLERGPQQLRREQALAPAPARRLRAGRSRCLSAQGVPECMTASAPCCDAAVPLSRRTGSAQGARPPARAPRPAGTAAPRPGRWFRAARSRT